jgi:hypothetical protein
MNNESQTANGNTSRDAQMSSVFTLPVLAQNGGHQPPASTNTSNRQEHKMLNHCLRLSADSPISHVDQTVCHNTLRWCKTTVSGNAVIKHEATSNMNASDLKFFCYSALRQIPLWSSRAASMVASVLQPRPLPTKLNPSYYTLILSGLSSIHLPRNSAIGAN